MKIKLLLLVVIHGVEWVDTSMIYKQTLDKHLLHSLSSVEQSGIFIRKLLYKGSIVLYNGSWRQLILL